MTQTIGSLFSGVGGFDLGFERAGFEVRWQCEIDKAARSVLRRHWPDVTIYEDVRNVGSGAERVDVVVGGFPCQDVSVAGRRAGLAGERSGLWFEFHRVLVELAPEWVVIENVPGLLSSNGGRDFAVILRGLVECGYGVVWRVLDSQYFGVPQRRRRVFIVGHLGSGRAAQVLFEREGGSGDIEPGSPARQTVTASPAGIAGTVSSKWAKGTGGPAGDEAYNLIALDTRPLEAAWIPCPDDCGEFWCTIHEMHVCDCPCPPIEEWEEQERDPYTPNVLAFNWQSGMGGRTYMSVGVVSPSLVKNQRHAIAGNGSVRRLTPTECERLQGFPDGWTAGQSDAARYKQMGNAVTVNVAEWIARRMMAVQP